MSGEPDGARKGELPRAVLDEIYAHARAGYPEEVCGLIIGGDEVRRCENRQNALHAEDPQAFPRDARTAYNLGPKDLFFLDKSLRSERPVRVIYHSHPDVGAYFSDEDARAATSEGELLYPVDYLVVDVRADGVRGARLFRFASGAFVEVASFGA
jgi:proteasome lid subunit RPN8/RPN11